jgi:uncharacterized protein
MTIKQPWFRIIIYYIIAVTLSGMFRLGIFEWYNNMQLPFGLTNFLKALLEGCGPITGAFVIWMITKQKSSITLFGTQTKKSLIMFSIPLLLFTFFGINNGQDVNPHIYGFIIGLGVVMYGIFEEYGWRGYLQNELKELKVLHRTLIIAVLWYAWHFTFIIRGTTLLNELMFFAIILFATWGIGAIVEKTKSIIAGACFHILGNILFTSSLVSNGFNNQTRYIIFGICLVSWIYIVNTWKKKSTVNNENIIPEDDVKVVAED